VSGVIVTGGASGIGRACAEALVAESRQVALWDVSPAVQQVAEAMGMPGAVVDVNLGAQAMLVSLLLPHLEKSARAGRGPAIVGISSIEGLAANPFIPAYCASKAGLLGLTRSMAAQLGPAGIRVNAVCPGFIHTPMLQIALDIEEIRAGFVHAAPLGRLGEPTDVAQAVAFLMSDRASFITGTQLVVDGGVTARHP
jgi:NAD(P)-dependent dehydrogenase (short-subunit alcohol dehydrogenase family)